MIKMDSRWKPGTSPHLCDTGEFRAEWVQGNVEGWPAKRVEFVNNDESPFVTAPARFPSEQDYRPLLG